MKRTAIKRKSKLQQKDTNYGYGKTKKFIDYSIIENDIQQYLNKTIIAYLFQKWTGQNILPPSGHHGFSNLPCPSCCDQNSSERPFSINKYTGNCKCWRTSCELYRDENTWFSFFDFGEKYLKKPKDQIIGLVAEEAGIRLEGMKIKPQVYYYPSEDDPKYRKIKNPDKSFRFEMLIDGKWQSGLIEDKKDEVRCLLFQDQLSAEENRKKVINIFEGEKDCLTAMKYGLLATTLDSGAESRWLSKYNPLFKGRGVRIWVDKDVNGYKYSYKIAKELCGIDKAMWVKVIVIPGLGHKQDFSDWIAMLESKRKDKKQIKEEIRHVAKSSKKLTEKQIRWVLTKLKIVKDLNKQYKFILSSEKNDILRITRDKDTGQNKYRPQPLSKMRANFANKLVTNPTLKQGKRGSRISKFDIYYNHPLREEYEDVIYRPLNPLFKGNIHLVGGLKFLNVFEGWPYAPIKGSWPFFRRFIFRVVCNSEKDKFKWLLARIAAILQDPCGDRIETFIAITGIMGSGKSFFIQRIAELFGKNAIYGLGSDMLTSRFKDHLVDKILVCADETVIKTSEEMKLIRGLTSSEKHAVEEKYKSITEQDNWVNLIIACDDFNIIVAAPGERRAALFNLSDKYRNNRKYFSKIQAELKNGGYEAMMYDLLHMDISKINLHEPPFTEELLQLKTMNRSSIDDFIISRINQNSIVGHDIDHRDLDYRITDKYNWELENDLYDNYKKWPKTPIITEALYELYLIHCEKNQFEPAAKPIFIRDLSSTDKPIVAPNGNIHRETVENSIGSKFRKRTVSLAKKLDAKKAIMKKYNIKWELKKANRMWEKTFGSEQ